MSARTVRTWTAVESSRNDSDNDLTLNIRTDGCTKNNIGIWISCSSNSFGRCIDFVHGEVIATNNIE